MSSVWLPSSFMVSHELWPTVVESAIYRHRRSQNMTPILPEYWLIISTVWYKFVVTIYSYTNMQVRQLNGLDLVEGGWQETCVLLVFPGGADVPYANFLNGQGNEVIRGQHLLYIICNTEGRYRELSMIHNCAGSKSYCVIWRFNGCTIWAWFLSSRLFEALTSQSFQSYESSALIGGSFCEILLAKSHEKPLSVYRFCESPNPWSSLSRSSISTLT